MAHSQLERSCHGSSPRVQQERRVPPPRPPPPPRPRPQLPPQSGWHPTLWGDLACQAVVVLFQSLVLRKQVSGAV